MRNYLIILLSLISGIIYGQAPAIKQFPVARINQVDQTARDSMDELRVDYNSLKNRVDSILYAAAQGPINITYTDRGYDSTYILSFTQHFAIPEDVDNDDVVGTWQKTFTWRSGNTVTYSIQTNHQSAFTINSSTGVLTIADATKIDGKVVQQDTVIKLIIKSTDAVMGYELDTAYVRVKENSYCRFIDYAYASTESGTKAQPYNDFSDATFADGYGYFIKRGNTPANKSYSLGGIAATSTNPIVIGAYGAGNRPEFNGSGLTTQDGLFVVSTIPSVPQNYKFYDIDAKNYPECVLRVGSGAKYFGIYNMKFQDNYVDEWTQDLAEIYLIGSVADSLNFKYHDIRNIESSGAYAPLIRSVASETNVYNIKTNIVTSSDGTTAPSISNKGWSVRMLSYSSINHFIFQGSGRHIQQYYPHSIYRDGYVLGGGDGVGFLGQVSGTDRPTGLVIDNLLVRNCYAGLYFFDGNEHDITISNCYFHKNTNSGIYFNNGGESLVIERTRIIDNVTNGIRLGGATVGTGNIIRYCVISGHTNGITSGNAAAMTSGTIHNVTTDDPIDMTNTTTSTIRNCFYKSIAGTVTASNNLDVDAITLTDYFQGHTTDDFRLKSTATSAINAGYNMSVTPDIMGTVVPQGSATEIGAYEYIP